MKHLQLYEGFLEDYESLSQQIHTMTDGLYEKITRFFSQHAQIKRFDDHPNWQDRRDLVLTLKQNDLLEMRYVIWTGKGETEAEAREAIPTNNVEYNKLKIYWEDGGLYTMGDAQVEDLVRLWDAIQKAYPVELEATEMGFYTKEG